jgi:chemotaxis protein histidine kinase CheA
MMLERFGGDAAFMCDVIDIYLHDARRAAHRLKGASGYFGGDPVVSLATRLEALADTGDCGAAESLGSELARALDRLLFDLRQARAAHAD